MVQAEVWARPSKWHEMKRFGSAAALIALVLAVAAPQARADDAALTARVQTAYEGQCADVMAGDFAAFQNTLSPDFTGSINGETVTRDEVVTSLKGSAASIKLTKCVTTIDSLQQSGDAIIVTIHQLLDGIATEAQGTAPIEIAAGKRDMWTSVGNALVQTSSLSVWTTTSVNGEIVQQTGIPPSAPPLPTPSPKSSSAGQ